MPSNVAPVQSERRRRDVPGGREGTSPALVMMYGAFGMNDEMHRVARVLAAGGCAVLIPDLFARRRVRGLCVARVMRTVLRGSGRELDDIEAGRRWLAAHPEIDADRIGTIGFRLGGSVALLLAGSGRYKVSGPFDNAPLKVSRSCPVVAIREAGISPRAGSATGWRSSTWPTTFAPTPTPATRSSVGPRACSVR
jgi:hypothetical protein